MRCASAPTAYTSPRSESTATTEGSETMMPRPRSKTSVLAVPRSTARSRCPKGVTLARAPQAVRRPAQAVAIAEARQGLAGGHGVVRQRLEGEQPLAQVIDADGGHLHGQPREPAHHRALVAL